MTSLPAGAANQSKDEWADLERLNVEQAGYYLPTAIFLGLLMAIGIPGNALVIYVYMRYLKTSSSDYFISTLAVFDLVACVTSIPLDIYDLLKPFTFSSDFACKLFRFTQNFTIFGSVVVLVQIAFDRYFKICKPLMFISLFKIKIMCAAATVIAVLFSSPALVVFGILRTNTHIPGLSGYDCSIAESYRNTTFVLYYYIGLAVLFIMILVTIGVLYVCVWMAVRKRRHMSMANLAIPRDQDDNAAPTTSVQTNYENVKAKFGSGTTIREVNNVKSSLQLGLKYSRSSNIRILATWPVSRTTTILFTITLVFILSFLPALTVMVIRVVMTDLRETKNIESLAAGEFFLKFYNINSSINPIIYSFLNAIFRHQARMALGVWKTQSKKKCKLTVPNQPDDFNHRRIPKHTQKSSDQADSGKAISSHSQTLPTDHASTPIECAVSSKAISSFNLTHTSDLTPIPSGHADSSKAISSHNSTHEPDHKPTPSGHADSPKSINISSDKPTNAFNHTPIPSDADSPKAISSLRASEHTPTPFDRDDSPKTISSLNLTHAYDRTSTPSGHADPPKAISSLNSSHAPDHMPTPSGHADSLYAISSHNQSHASDHTPTPMEFAESSKAIMSSHNPIRAPEHTYTPTETADYSLFLLLLQSNGHCQHADNSAADT